MLKSRNYLVVQLIGGITRRVLDMKKEYDFSKGVRGKFYHKGDQLRLPIYLNLSLQHRLEKLAQAKNEQIGDLVGRLLKKVLQLVQQ